ncbi:hypothetical protein E2C01_051825 [Portunus trituberculatus]|uniref:Uncharacterized protein n=1 Tax=Portunus trituberculatus TaxID=210409 RepID=A0A5B7GKR3_PORTR|nr:hypothetical protein [Portunus trituberculatus]
MMAAVVVKRKVALVVLVMANTFHQLPRVRLTPACTPRHSRLA